MPDLNLCSVQDGLGVVSMISLVVCHVERITCTPIAGSVIHFKICRSCLCNSQELRVSTQVAKSESITHARSFFPVDMLEV